MYESSESEFLQGRDQKIIPYFIECFARKNKLMT